MHQVTPKRRPTAVIVPRAAKALELVVWILGIEANQAENAKQRTYKWANLVVLYLKQIWHRQLWMNTFFRNNQCILYSPTVIPITKNTDMYHFLLLIPSDQESLRSSWARLKVNQNPSDTSWKSLVRLWNQTKRNLEFLKLKTWAFLGFYIVLLSLAEGIYGQRMTKGPKCLQKNETEMVSYLKTCCWMFSFRYQTLN